MFNQKEYRKTYNKKNAEKRNAYSRMYYRLHKNDSEYIQKRRDYWWKNHTPRKLLTEEEKKVRLKQSRQNWKEKNHETILNYNRNHRFRYHWQLISWAKLIKKRDKKCQVCFEPTKHAHHIFYKSKHPELSMNLNNGIGLCEQHHNEIHWGVS